MNLEPKIYATSKQGPTVGPFASLVDAIAATTAYLAASGTETEATIFGVWEIRVRRPVLEPQDASGADRAEALRGAAAGALPAP